MFDQSLSKLLDLRPLSFDEARGAMDEVMEGKVSEIKISSWLTALRLKGETPDEIGGCAASMNAHATMIRCLRGEPVDIVGTGGDGAKTFNVSTAAAFVAAGAGITVAKHGNRSVSSKSGAADVLTEHGIDISISPAIMEKCLNDIGISFLFAPVLHPAMKYVMPVRKELATRTIFNILGPLCNPAKTPKMLIGVYDKKLVRIFAEALLKLGKKHVFVVHGSDGLDEISNTGATTICEVRDGSIREFEFHPSEAGIKIATPDQILGGTPGENAATIRQILHGELRGPKRDIVVLNAAAAAIVAGLTSDWKEATHIADTSIDSGNAAGKLESLIRCSRCTE
ncbi:MAG: anthranilate phosphoribosyltransferase [Victivallales bacterium]|nr:anthranilate phosphoribosyltransferase [Victivallales bacterium]